MTTQEPPPAPKKPRRRSRRSKTVRLSSADRVLILRRAFAAESLRSALDLLAPRGDFVSPPHPLDDRFLVAKATDLVHTALATLRLILCEVGVGFTSTATGSWIGPAAESAPPPAATPNATGQPQWPGTTP